MKTEFVFKWMSPEPITVTPETGLRQAQQLLSDYHIRRLPVVDEQRDLVGIITQGDLHEALDLTATRLNDWELNYLASPTTVKEVMTPKPITVYTTDVVGKAAITMLTYKVSGLPVVTPADHQLVGIITESDIFAMVAQSWEEVEALEADLAW